MFAVFCRTTSSKLYYSTDWLCVEFRINFSKKIAKKLKDKTIKIILKSFLRVKKFKLSLGNKYCCWVLQAQCDRRQTNDNKTSRTHIGTDD